MSHARPCPPPTVPSTPPAEENEKPMATTSLPCPHRWRSPRRSVILGAAIPEGIGSRPPHAQRRAAPHDSVRALTPAQALSAATPAQVAALATVGDAQLGLGRYAAAARPFAALAGRARGPAVTARRAHLA